MKLIFSLLVGVPFLALLLLWYQSLWWPTLAAKYWTQLLPIAAVIFLIQELTQGFIIQKLVSQLLSVTVAASMLLQVLVWTGHVTLPLY